MLPAADLSSIDNVLIVKAIGEAGGIFPMLNEARELPRSPLIPPVSPDGLVMLSETQECVVPKGSDESLLQKLLEAHKKDGIISRAKARDAFVVKHFVGPVTYVVSGFLEKNKDAVSEDLLVLLERSDSSFVEAVFAPKSETTALLTKKKASASPPHRPLASPPHLPLGLSPPRPPLASTPPHSP